MATFIPGAIMTTTGGGAITYNLTDGSASGWQKPSSLALETLTAYFGPIKRIEVSCVETVIGFDSGASLRLPTDVKRAFSIVSGPAPSAETFSATKTYPEPELVDHIGSINSTPDGHRWWECECGGKGHSHKNVKDSYLRKRFIHHAGDSAWQWEDEG
jgi:hypothetical protein